MDCLYKQYHPIMISDYVSQSDPVCSPGSVEVNLDLITGWGNPRHKTVER